MTPEIHVCIIWERGRFLENKIIADLSEKFELCAVFESLWPRQEFAARLSRFYGKRLPKGCRKEKECGRGKFTVAVVKDPHPKILQGLNLNLCAAKTRYRQWLGGNLLHASDNAAEGWQNLEQLTGINAGKLSALPAHQWKEYIENHLAAAAEGGEKFLSVEAAEADLWLTPLQRWLLKLNQASRRLLQNFNLW